MSGKRMLKFSQAYIFSCDEFAIIDSRVSTRVALLVDASMCVHSTSVFKTSCECVGFRRASPLLLMAPHLSPVELDFVFGLAAQKKTPAEVHAALVRRRSRQGLEAPTLKRFRSVLRGTTYRRSRKETRGRKQKLTGKAVRKLNTIRKRLIKKADGQREVRWQDVRKAARVPKMHRTTLKRSFHREGIQVEARRPRLKPKRTPSQVKARIDYCTRWCRKPASFFLDKVDLIIDNKHFDVPTTERARQFLAAQRVRYHLRTAHEGSQPEMQKPGRKKNRLNTGAQAKVCAGISGGKIVMWEYLPKQWNAKEAVKLYEGAIMTTLKNVRGAKPKYLVFEDNDPTGYKSNKAKAAKRALKIEAVPSPVSSPDLNPLDFSLWEEISKRMVLNAPDHVETVDAYKKRMRLTALRLPRSLVAKTVEAMPRRMEAVVQAKGYSISFD